MKSPYQRNGKIEDEMKSLDALLIFPPAYIPTELQPGIAAVAGYAKEQ